MKKISLITGLAFGLFLGGCGSMTPLFSGGNGGETYRYQNIDFGTDRSETFKQGVQDGCATAGGKYAKNHTLFRSNEDYKIGWEDGRIKCGPKS